MTAVARSLDPGALRRGACPSLAAPMQTGDGLLVRLRPKAAGLAPQDLLAIARLARETGNGLIEITARGNLQIRGLRNETVPRLPAGLAEAGIALLTGVVVETPPLAGLDPEEIDDPLPLAGAIRRAAADAALPLAPKLAIVVDGGGRLSLADAVADVRLDAVAGGAIASGTMRARPAPSPPWGEGRGSGMRGAPEAQSGSLAPSSDPSGHLLPGGEKEEPRSSVMGDRLAVTRPAGVLWRLSLGGDRSSARPVGVLPEERAVEAVLTVLRTLADRGPAARGRDLDAGSLRTDLNADAEDVLPADGISAIHPLGLHTIAGETVLGIAPAYGQTHADRFSALIEALTGLGAREFRLAPHRALLVRGLAEADIEAARAIARTHGFWCDANAPGRAISVCAGSAGCASATFDTHAAADAIAARAPDLLDGSLDVHVAGCPKGCAHPAPAGVTLCGTAAGIGLVLSGRASDAPSASVAPAALGDAIGRLGKAVQSRRTHGESAARLLDRVPADLLSSAYQGLS